MFLIWLRRNEMKARRLKLDPPVPASKHKLGMVVPHGGSSCASCKHFAGYFSDREIGEAVWDGDASIMRPRCISSDWVKASAKKGGGGGSTAIPVYDASDWCCDAYEYRGRAR
jgi:hypothetical protein